MIKTTRWTLDTCKCVLDLHWDDSVDVSEGASPIVSVSSVTKCPLHAHHASGADHYQAVLAHNRDANVQANKV